MEGKKFLIIIIVVFVIIVLICILNAKKENNAELTYNMTVDNTTGTTYYQIYNDKGNLVRNVTDKAAVQMYKDNPDFVGSKVNSNEDVELDTNEYESNSSAWGNPEE